MQSSRDLLPGERFCPMEDELLMFYLKPKVNGKKVPGNDDVICEVDLYGQEDPWEIWKRFEAGKAKDLRMNKDLYFFTKTKKKTAKGSRASRTVGHGGTWKGQGRGKDVFLLDENQTPTSTLLGSKKTYTYLNRGSVQHGRWIMYEFELDESQILHKKANKNEYVLCVLKKNDVLPDKKRKRQEEDDQMVEDYVEDDCGDQSDHNSSELVLEEPQEKRQRLVPSVQDDEQERFLANDQELLQPEPSLEYGQEAAAAPLASEGEPPFFQMDENMGLQIPPMLNTAELEQLFDGEFMEGRQEGQAPQEEESGDAPQVFETYEQEHLLAEENLGQQLHQAPTVSANDVVGSIRFDDQDENMVQQTGAEALGEVDNHGGNLVDDFDPETWSMDFDPMNFDLPASYEEYFADFEL